jgi:RNA polymerase sigma factor (sigma-70 family)
MMGLMSEDSDGDLLRAFVSSGNEEAFAEVVRRWGSLVYGAAWRRTGDHSLAEEATQNVFTNLARRAGELARHPALAAWLHKTAGHEAARAMRKESNRRRHMYRYTQEMVGGGAGSEPPLAPAWQDALPEIDAAVAELPELDRQILIMRYWQSQPYRVIAEAAGSSVDACEKRAERALAKLSRILRRRGVALSATALAAGLNPAMSHGAVTPAALARLTSGALAGAQATPATTGILTTLIMIKSKFAPVALLALVMALGGAGGFMAARSVSRGSHGKTVGASSARTAAGNGAPKPQRILAPGSARRDSLHALLSAAQRDLATAGIDVTAGARAAARIAVIAAEDIQAALSLADELMGASGESFPLAALVLERWAEFDPQAACETAHRRGPGKIHGEPALAEPLKVWAARDPKAAFDWYRAHASAEESARGNQRWKPVSSLRWIMGAWGMRDAAAAAAAYKTLNSPDEIAGALIGFGELSGTAPGRTAILDAWLEKTAYEERRGFRHNLSGLIGCWSEYEPAELADWLEASGLAHGEFVPAARSVLKGWLAQDSAAAIDWWFKSSGATPDPARRTATLLDAWAGTDVFAAAEWLAAQPVDANTAVSMRVLASHVALTDPERGWEWALNIAQESHRADALGQVAVTWAQTDREAAAAAVAAAPLDEAKRAEILQSLATP